MAVATTHPTHSDKIKARTFQMCLLITRMDSFPFLMTVKAIFPSSLKICVSIGGWGENIGHEVGSMPSKQASYASDIASVVQSLGFDCAGMFTKSNIPTCLCSSSRWECS